jgi:chorismate lyase/3-hydroxybenzoate synthase
MSKTGAILQVSQTSHFEPAEAPFAVCYLGAAAAGALLAAGQVLGVVGYGAKRPEYLAADCPFLAAPLFPASGDAMLEIWRSASAVEARQVGPVMGRCGDDVAFGAVELVEANQTSLEATVEAAYLAIFDFLDQTGFTAPIRFWNYLTAITQDDGGLERYMRFNIGRHRAFAARLRQPVPPAASGVGGDQGKSVIYFLAAREPARAIENPRQVSAYAYPPVYGPRSPSFSRASIYARGNREALFISGTASIVGHETRHPGDLAAQIAETMENLRALTGAAGESTNGDWFLKIYLQDPGYRSAVEPALNALFGPDSQRLYLRGDICRTGLLLEIEAFRA